MSGVKRFVRCLGLLLVLIQAGGAVAHAETSTERSGSVLVFPKVIFDGSRDTFIQITNTSNSMVHAHCFYVSAVPECNGVGSCLDDTCVGECIPSWVEVDFEIWLTKQQPTSWSAGFGRLSDPNDSVCFRNFQNGNENYDCYGAGLDPGRVPPVSDPFVGELKCIEVDPSGAPISGNHLKGEATIVGTTGDASKYNAIGVIGLDANNGDTTLCLGGGVSDRCPSGAEYNGCAETLILDHFAQGADSPLFGSTSSVTTELTLVPCSQDFETQNPSRVVVQFLITNEYEQSFSASTTVDCWANFELNDVNLIFDLSRLSTRAVQTRMRPASGTPIGILGVSEEYHSLSGQTARAAFNIQQEGERAGTDYIVIPEGP